MFGGGMRQAGYMASTAIYALENNIDRLHEDHDNAKLMADFLSNRLYVADVLPVETNIVIFEVKGRFSPVSFTNKLKEHTILAFPISPTQVRMVTHLDLTAAMIQETIEVLESF